MSSPETLKLLFILDAFPDPHAGTEGQFWLLLNQLDRSRVQPEIVLLRPSPWLQAHANDIPVHVLNIERLRSLNSLAQIARVVYWARRRRFRIAHIFFNDSAVVFPLLLRVAGIRVIVSRRDLGFWYTPGVLKLLRFNQRFVDAVIANATAVKGVVQKAEGFPANKIHVIYNGVRRECSEATDDLLTRFGIPVGAPLLAIVANLRPLKRINDVIMALARISKSGERPHLVVMGDDRSSQTGNSHAQELAQLAQSLSIGGQVHIVGKVDDPMPLLSRSNVCLLCSETEGLSNSIIEYMFAGRPVVCTDVGGNPELVEHNSNGFVVEVGDVQAIADAVVRLLQDPKLQEQMGKRSRERAMRLFHPSAMLDAHMSIYEQLRKVGT